MAEQRPAQNNPSRPKPGRPAAAKKATTAPDPVIEEQEEDPNRLQGMLLKRLVVAGGMVGVLLGTLAFFDYLASSDDNDPPVFTQPVPVAPRKEVTQPVRAAENLPPPPEPEKPAEPEKAPEAAPSKPAVEPPPPPKVPAVVSLPPASKPAPVEKAAEKSVPVRPAPAQPGSQATAPRPAASKPAEVPAISSTPERTEAPSTSPAAPAQATAQPTAKPAARITDIPLMRAPLASMRAPNGFVLQAGVFASSQRAEELHAKLTLNGIPSTLESRVQVGPFKTREEADAAYTKLRALGIDAMLIPPANLRR